MRKFIAILIIVTIGFFSLSFGATDVSAVQRVKGYSKKNGTYVKPYYRSNRDSYKFNNYSSKGNTNPFTGKKGTKNYYRY